MIKKNEEYLSCFILALVMCIPSIAILYSIFWPKLTVEELKEAQKYCAQIEQKVELSSFKNNFYCVDR